MNTNTEKTNQSCTLSVLQARRSDKKKIGKTREFRAGGRRVLFITIFAVTAENR